jgi:hypothetical protein
MPAFQVAEAQPAAPAPLVVEAPAPAPVAAPYVAPHFAPKQGRN